MSELEHLRWGVGPQYLLASRFDAVDPELVPVPVERAPAVIYALLHDDATALQRLAVSMRWLEPEQSSRREGRALARRVLDELEHPAGRLSLWERPRDESLGKPGAGLELDDVVDLLDLVDESETTWIEFRLHDQNDEPFAGLEYELDHPDGRQTSGRLGELGVVHESDIPAGSYTIRFPAAELVVLGEDGPDVGPLAPYGVVRLELVGAGGARSTGWTAHDDPPAADAEPNFWLASGGETVKISYTIEDPEGRAEAATLELFVLDDDGDEQVLWRRPLTDDERAAGAHELDWDGAVDVSEALPEGFVTVLRSPYALRLRLRGHGEADPPEASTRLWVDVASIELSLGEAAMVDRDGACEAVQTGLGGAIGDIAAHSRAPGDGRDVEDVSRTARDHPREDGVGDVIDGVDVHVHHLVPLTGGEIDEGLLVQNAGVVDEAGQPAQLLIDVREHRQHLVLAGHVGLEGLQFTRQMPRRSIAHRCERQAAGRGLGDLPDLQGRE